MDFFHSVRRMSNLVYELGPQFNVNAQEIDCFGMIVRFIKLRYNVDLPQDFNGKTALEWYEYYNWDEALLVPLFIEYIELHFDEIPNNYQRSGDILVLDESSESPSIGIYSGIKHFLICTPESCITSVSLTPYTLSRVFRWADL